MAMDWGDRGSLIITRKYSPQGPFPAGNHRTLCGKGRNQDTKTRQVVGAANSHLETLDRKSIFQIM